jgi:hypothetical protein
MVIVGQPQKWVSAPHRSLRVASAAQRFGREGDISVITVTRVSVPEMAYSSSLQTTFPDGTESL